MYFLKLMSRWLITDHRYPWTAYTQLGCHFWALVFDACLSLQSQQSWIQRWWQSVSMMWCGLYGCVEKEVEYRLWLLSFHRYLWSCIVNQTMTQTSVHDLVLFRLEGKEESDNTSSNWVFHLRRLYRTLVTLWSSLKMNKLASPDNVPGSDDSLKCH